MAVAAKRISWIDADLYCCCFRIPADFCQEEWWSFNRKIKRARELALEQSFNPINARYFYRAVHMIDSPAHRVKMLSDDQCSKQVDNRCRESSACITAAQACGTTPRRADTDENTQAGPIREVTSGEYIHLGITNRLRLLA
ncbi:hypothetical protein CSKR_105433 [Clonorchis sinensis]|uniref:Uncharacterized protein n=1 Tax=Clonorchis sinensis TaxID=79923 RepID=A0A3R7JT50_CLOSI|nr:hypothetical protein CSKR_105433 [Clonorchis sinensis]